MSQDIKPGDMVMIVYARPCCGELSSLHGIPFIAGKSKDHCLCNACGTVLNEPCVLGLRGYTIPKRVLKKIDPPADGDSLPTRRDLDVPA